MLKPIISSTLKPIPHGNPDLARENFQVVDSFVEAGLAFWRNFLRLQKPYRLSAPKKVSGTRLPGYQRQIKKKPHLQIHWVGLGFRV